MKTVGGWIALIFAIMFLGGTVGALMSFDFIMFITSLPLFLLFAWLFGMSVRDDKPKTNDPWPCPRCANKYVDLYDQGKWQYFTCGSCGARGWYPFRTLEQRQFRAH